MTQASRVRSFRIRHGHSMTVHARHCRFLSLSPHTSGIRRNSLSLSCSSQIRWNSRTQRWATTRDSRLPSHSRPHGRLLLQCWLPQPQCCRNQYRQASRHLERIPLPLRATFRLQPKAVLPQRISQRLQAVVVAALCLCRFRLVLVATIARLACSHCPLGTVSVFKAGRFCVSRPRLLLPRRGHLQSWPRPSRRHGGQPQSAQV